VVNPRDYGLLCTFTQVREDVFAAGQNQEREAKNARKETHATSDIRRSAQGETALSVLYSSDTPR